MKTSVLTGVLFFASVTIFAQKEKENNTTTEPQGKWKVNKHYDKQGNLIAYDSIYTWSSTGDYRDFDQQKSEKAEPFFKGFIRDFEVPDLNFENDSIALGFKDFFKDFNFPDLDFNSDFNFPDIPLDSLSMKEFQKNFSIEHFDMHKEIESLKQQMEEMKKNFQKFLDKEATETKKQKEGKI